MTEPSLEQFSVNPIRFDDLFSGALEPFGIREHVHEYTSDRYRCLTDGEEELWAWGSPGGLLDSFEPNHGRTIGMAIEEAFGTDLYSIFVPLDGCGTPAESWLPTFKERAERLSLPLYADILARCWKGAEDLASPDLRDRLAAHINEHCSWEREERPRSLEDTARYMLTVTTTSSEFVPRFHLDWKPAVRGGMPMWVHRIVSEIEKDEFLVSWLDEDGRARRLLQEWADAADERFLKRHRHQGGGKSSSDLRDTPEGQG